MATSDFTSALLGPHFAPVDPTLPKPWIGLIDGSTGLLYYWNPGTNITQYERPADPAIAPPLPPGPPPSAALKITPIPVAGTLNPDVIQQQPGPQILQQPSQQMPQLLDQQHQKLPPSQQLPFQQPNQHQQMSQQQPQLISYPLTQDGKQQFHQPNQRFSQQLQQMQYPQVSYLQGQLMLCMQGQQLEGLQMSHQHGRKLQEPQMLQLQGQHLKGPQIHQLGQQPQWSQISHQQGQQPVGIRQQGKQPQGLEITNQEGQQVQWQQSHTQRLGHLQGQQGGFPRAEVAGLQERIEAGPTSPLVHQTGMISSTHYFPGGSPQVSHPLNPPQQLGGLFSVSMQQAGCAQVQLQQEGLDTIYIQQQTGAPMAPNVMEHATCRPPVGLRMGSEEDWHRRAGNDVYVSRGNDGSMLPPEQPKFAPLPLVMNWQDIRMGSINSQFSSQGHAMPDSYNHAPLPHAGPMGPPLRMMRSPQFPRMSAADAYRQHHEVTTMGDNVPAPFMTFEATGFPPDILREMHFAGFSTPTPIQAQTWPVALQNRDVVAIAKTGSGKTLAYLIPAIIRLRQCRNNPQNGPKVMILAPTRYHVTQVQEEALKFGHSSRISCTCLYSGAPKGSQLQELERGVDIVVATPRQLNDIHEMRKINFCQVSMLVLDEADQMLDMGFQPQIRRIVNAIPHRRQTLMYTATWPKEVRKMAGDLLANAVQITVGSVDELAANKSITQFVEVITEMDKERRLEQIIRAQEFGSKIIIFCSTKKLCDQLAGSIGRTFGAVAIHGDESQDEKDHVLNEFHAGRARVLVATDVAARGLYIKHIGAVVINYDFPSEIEDYVHQIGQTGMAGATGVSYTFFSDRNWKYATDLIKVLEGANQHVPPEVREMAAHGGPVYPGGGEHGGISHWDSEGGGWDSGGARGMMRNGEGRRGITMDDRGRRGMMSYGTGGNFDGRDGGSVEFYGGHGGTTRGFGGSIGAGGRGGQHRGPSNRFNHLLRGYDRSRSRSRSHSCSRSWSPSRSRSQSRSRSPNHDYDRFARPCKRVSGFDAPLAAPTQQAPPAASGVGVLLAPPLGPRYEAPTMSVFDVCQMSPMSPGPANGSFITVNESPDKRIWPGGLPNTGMDPGFTHVLYLWNKMGGCKHSRVTSKKGFSGYNL